MKGCKMDCIHFSPRPPRADSVATAWQFAHFAEQNLRSLADGIGRLIVAEPDDRRRDVMLSPYFAVRRAQHQLRGRGR
jgi:hypothetical protein